MMNHSTSGLFQRYIALCRVFPPAGERQVFITDFGPRGCFSAVIENGVTTHYDYDIESPDRYCPNREVQPAPEPEPEPVPAPESATPPESEPRSFSSRSPAGQSARDHDSTRPSDPVLYDHLTKFAQGPPLDPPLWETWSQKPPIREGPPLPDNPAGKGFPALGELRLIDPPRAKSRRH